MKKLIITAVALVCVCLAWAIVERAETMTVVKTDGTKIEFNVDEIDVVSFGVTEHSYQMTVAPAGAEAEKIETIPAVFRKNPAVDGEPYVFGISMVEAAQPADARQGNYAVQISVSQLKMNTADVDLAGGSNSGVTVTIYKYDAEGAVAAVWESQSAGKLTTAVDTKSKAVTINLEASFSDGTELVVDFKGKVTDVDSLDGLNPPFVYVNQGRRFDADGIPGSLFDVTGLDINKDFKFQGEPLYKFDLTLSNGFQCFVAVKPEFIGKKVVFSDGDEKAFRVSYNDVQLAAKGFEYMPQGTDGWFLIVKNDDDTYTIDLDFYNRYIDIYGVAHNGSKERVILNYTSSDTYPDPKPEPIENLLNQSQYFDGEGNPEFPLDIVSLTCQENKAIPYNSDAKGSCFNFNYGDATLPTCYIIIDPSFIGKTFDLATAPAKSFYFKYGATEIAASDLSWMGDNVGTEGTVKVRKHKDGTYSVDLNISFKTNGNPDTNARLALNYTSPTASCGDVEPEPEPVVYVNQGQHFMPDGDAESIFDITGCTQTSNARVNGVSGYEKFDLTLSNNKSCYVAIKPEYIGQEIDFATAVKDAFLVKYDAMNYGTKDNSAFTPAGINGKLKVVKNDDGSYSIDLDYYAHYINYGTTNDTSKERVVLNYTTAAPEPEPVVYVNQGQHFMPDGDAESIFDITGCTQTSNARVNGVSGYEKFDLTLSNNKSCYVAIKPEYIGQEIDFATAVKDAFLVKYDAMNYGTKDNSAFTPAGINGKLKVVKNDDGSYTIDLDYYAHYINYGTTNDTSKERVVLNYTTAAPEPEPVVYVNQGQHFMPDGDAESIFDITGCTQTSNARVNGVSGYEKFDLTLSNNKSCYVAIKPEYIGQEIDFATAVKDAFLVKYDAMNYGTKDNSAFTPAGINGKLKVVKNDDGSYTIDLDYYAHYINYGTTNDTSKERVILNYTTAAPEPEPVVYVNQGQHFMPDGDAESIFDITGCTQTSNARVNGVSGYEKFDLTLSNGKSCYVAIKPEYIGQEIDFATAVKDAFLVKYDAMNYGTKDNSAFTPAGINGKLKVVKNDDGSYTIDLDYYAHYINYGTTNDTSKERVVLNYTTAAPEPEPVVYVNQGQHFMPDGDAESIFDITGCTQTSNARVNGVSGYEKFDLTLSNNKSCYVAIKPEYIGQEIDFATAVKDAFLVKYDAMNYGTKDNSAFTPAGINGKLKVVKNDDGSYTIDLDYYAHYVNYGTTNDTSKERVILNYTTPAPVIEEPEAPNQCQHYTADGDAEKAVDVTGLKLTSGVRINGVQGFEKFEFTLSNDYDCYVAVKPEFIGQEIDFATAVKDSFIVQYGYNINYGTKDNSSFMPAGINGKLKIVKNDDGTYTIDLDCYAHYINYGMTNDTSKERVVLHYKGAAN